MVQFSAKDIQVLPITEAIRRAPRRYVEDTTLRGLHQFVLTLAKAAIDPERTNECTDLVVTVHADESLSLSDDGCGQPVYFYPLTHPQPLIESVMTSLYAGGSLEDVYRRFGYLFNLGPIVNALSEWLVLETVTEGIKYKMTCERGNISQTLHAIDKSNDKGTYLHFKPDSTIWSETKFSAAILATGLNQLETEYAEVTISLVDERLVVSG